MLFFHLHFNVADVTDAEARQVAAGFAVKARFGYAGREHRKFEPHLTWEELDSLGVRLRLVELERGAVNVVLMRSRFPEVRLGQVGFVVDDLERAAILERAARRQLRVRDHEVRWLITTGQGFDLELADPSRHAYDDAARAELRLDGIEIACSDPEAAQGLFADLLGPTASRQVRFTRGRDNHAELRSCALAGALSVATGSLPL
jgi:hypothetical protein